MSLPLLDVCAAHGCAACCHETEMPLTEEDAARLERLGHPRGAFAVVDPDDRGLYLANVPGPAGERPRCYFLRGGRCSVYVDRPTGCRIYPFVLNEDGKVVRDADCPHAKAFPRAPDLQRRIQRVATALSREASRR